MAANKRAGKKSAASNDFLQPLAPVSVSATDVGTDRPYNNGAATVSFSLPGNSPAATSYTVTATAAGQTTRTATGVSSPITVSSLAAGVTYTVSVTATNAVGTSESSATTTVFATTVPDTIVLTAAADPATNSDNLTWSPPANGGKAITNYYWTSSDGKSGNTAATSLNVTQEQGTAQTYTVRADNANGVSGTSSASPSVTTFSFVPFGVFGFSPFGVFGFSPFGVFGFSPFGVFAFSPYGFGIWRG